MAEERIQRRLVAILAADVVGYSRLMEQDEAGTLAVLKSRRRNVVGPLIAQHEGRIFKTTGDGVLVQFGSAVNAVQCAMDVQRAMAAAAESQPADRRIVLRVGINLGDVIAEGSDLYGDGVNIAARLEGISEPGGILLSGAAYEQVKNKIELRCDDLGPQNLKNIAEPVRAYRIADTPRVAVTGIKHSPDRFSIAVLPFITMGGDAEQQYFGDGITEDIITELSRFRQLRVVARNSSFRYRGQDVDVTRVGRELGVQYLVEGSVRRIGDRIRITAQLIDASSGHHVWAERFDRNKDDLFAVQDQMVRTIAVTIGGRLEAADTNIAKRKPPSSLDAYDCVLRGDALPLGEHQAAAEARRLFEQAIELDPDYAVAHTYLAYSFYLEWHRDMSGSNAALDEALRLSKKAVLLDPHDSRCHTALGWIYLAHQSFEQAEQHYLKARELNPNSPMLVASLGDQCVSLGRPAEAIDYYKEAKLLDPFFEPPWYDPALGVAYFLAHQYDEAIAALSRPTSMFFWGHAYLAASYALAGRIERARQSAAEVLRLVPDFSSSRFDEKEPYKRAEDRQHLLEGLRLAGLPG
ncbi:MAG TPA: adenylate/guanylate cyclase domain-containing protein [Dongiaceae bacterium]